MEVKVGSQIYYIDEEEMQLQANFFYVKQYNPWFQGTAEEYKQEAELIKLRHKQWKD